MNCAASRGIATGRAHGGASFTQPYGAHLLPFRPRDRVIGSVSPAPPPTSIGPEDSARAASLRSLPFCPTGSSRSSTGSSARSGSAFPARVFGEALIALGTPVPGAHRAADPSRHAGRDSGILRASGCIEASLAEGEHACARARWRTARPPSPGRISRARPSSIHTGTRRPTACGGFCRSTSFHSIGSRPACRNCRDSSRACASQRPPRSTAIPQGPKS
jgi:hypothetical protein